MVAVTHSPLLRAVLLGTGADPGEPGYVTGTDVRVPRPAGSDLALPPTGL